MQQYPVIFNGTRLAKLGNIQVNSVEHCQGGSLEMNSAE
jgi:hypothetical protein